MNNKILQFFHLYGSEAFSRTEDKRANIIAKDIPLCFYGSGNSKDLAGDL